MIPYFLKKILAGDINSLNLLVRLIVIFAKQRSNTQQSFQFINKYVLTLELYEVRNIVTCRFAFCDCTLIVAMVRLQEPHFPKHVFS